MERRTEILSAKKRQLFPGERISKNKHEYLQIFYVLNGRMSCSVEGTNYISEQRNGVIILPNQSHEVLEIQDAPLLIYDVKFYVHDEYILDNLSRIPPLLQGGEFVETLLGYLHDNAKFIDSQNTSNIDTFFCALLIYLFRDNLRYEPNSSLYVITENYHNLTKRTLYYIEHNYEAPFSMDALSKNIGYHKNYTSTIFRRDTGVAVIDYLNFVRIRQAVIDIIYNHVSVTTASERTGFNSPNHFGRVFKSIVGVSPNGLRNAVSEAMRSDDIYLFTYENVLSNQKLRMAEAFESMRSLGKLTMSILEKRGIAREELD